MRARHYTGNEYELFIGQIYRSILGVAPMKDALEQLAHLTHSDKVLLGRYDLRRRAGYIEEAWNVQPPFLRAYAETHAAGNVWLAKSQYFQLEGLIWHGSKIVSEQELVGTPFYKEFLAPQDMHHTLHIAIASDGDRVVHAMLTRPQREPDFSESEIEIARCFALHARRALEDRKAADGARMIQAALVEATEDAGWGIAVLDPPAVLFASATFEKILTSLGAPGNGRNGGSEARTRQMLFPRAVADAINSARDSSSANALMSRPDGGKVLANVKAFSLGGHPPRRSGVVVTLVDLTQGVIIDQELLQRAYDLTATEARVCSLLADGQSVDDVSEKLGISPNTARTHIKRIFSKTGATRQASLVKLLLSAAALQRNGRASSAALPH